MARLDWASLTREELADAAPSAVTVLPVAAIEQHGPHLPTVVDTALVTAIAGRACDRVDAATILAPTQAFGASDHHLPFGATLSLTALTFRSVVRDLLRSAARAGCTRVLVLNGHGGNAAICADVASEAAEAEGIVVATCSYWELLPAPPGVPGRYPGHAGVVETSLMLAVAPELVRLDRARRSPGELTDNPSGLRVADPAMWQRLDGYTDDPRAASAELGEELLGLFAEAVAAAIDHLGRS